MPSGRDSFRRNRVAPFVLHHFTTSQRGVSQRVPFRLNPSLQAHTTDPPDVAAAPSELYFWAQRYARVVDSHQPTFQNDKTGNSHAKTR